MPSQSPTHSQLDFFPERVVVEALDARAIAGGRSRVRAMFRVQYEREDAPHQVFHDQYGWYCADHGKDCRAVAAARGQRHPR